VRRSGSAGAAKWIGGFLIFGCCICSIGGFFAFRFFGGLGQELAWLQDAQKAAERATQPPAADLALIRQIQAGAPLTPENLSRLEGICDEMTGRTQAAWNELDAKPVPPRLVAMKEKLRHASDKLQSSYRELADGIARRDERAVRATLGGLQGYWDGLRVDVESELKRLYPQR